MRELEKNRGVKGEWLRKEEENNIKEGETFKM